MRKILWVLAAALFVAQAAFAEPNKVSRPAVKKDLVGTWEMVSVRPVFDGNDPVFYPHQRFVFNGNASMKFMASENPFTEEWLDKFRKQPAEIDYSVDDKGILTLMWQKQPHQERAIAAYVLQDVPADVLAKLPKERRQGLPKKGDLTISFLNSKGKISYQKVLTRIG